MSLRGRKRSQAGERKEAKLSRRSRGRTKNNVEILCVIGSFIHLKGGKEGKASIKGGGKEVQNRLQRMEPGRGKYRVLKSKRGDVLERVGGSFKSLIRFKTGEESHLLLTRACRYVKGVLGESFIERIGGRRRPWVRKKMGKR